MSEQEGTVARYQSYTQTQPPTFSADRKEKNLPHQITPLYNNKLFILLCCTYLTYLTLP